MRAAQNPHDGWLRRSVPESEKSGFELGVQAVFIGNGRYQRIPGGVGDHASVDLELAAQGDEQPRSFGPDPLRLGRHAPQQHVIRPSIRLRQRPGRQRAGRYKLRLLHHPLEYPANTSQVLARARDAVRDGVIHHAVFDVPCIPQRPVSVGQPADDVGRHLGLQVFAGRGFELVGGEARTLEIMVQLLNSEFEVLTAGLKSRALNQVHRAFQYRPLFVIAAVGRGRPCE